MLIVQQYQHKTILKCYAYNEVQFFWYYSYVSFIQIRHDFADSGYVIYLCIVPKIVSHTTKELIMISTKNAPCYIY